MVGCSCLISYREARVSLKTVFSDGRCVGPVGYEVRFFVYHSNGRRYRHGVWYTYGVCSWAFGSVTNVGSVSGMIVGRGCSLKTVNLRGVVVHIF